MKPQHGQGTVIRLKQKDPKTGEVRDSRFWYILYYVAGRQVRENTKTDNYQEAYNLLVKRRTEAEKGEQPASDIAKLRYEDIRDSLMLDYTNRKVASLYQRKRDKATTVQGLDYLNTFFKKKLVGQIDTGLLRKYISWRQKEGDSDPTIRRQLKHLEVAFNLAVKENKLKSTPYFPMPKDSEPAGQYIAPEDFQKILTALPEKLRPFYTFLYYTSCRLGAAQEIRWPMVSADATEIKIPAHLMKARNPLTVVLAGPGLEPVSKLLKKMFRKNGDRVFDTTNYRYEWHKASHAAGVGVRDSKRRTYKGARIHDLRVSAAINMSDAGVPEDIIMKIGGWKTKAMFSRYNVMNTDRIRKAMEQGGKHVAEKIAAAQ
jgi:integrase